MISIRLLSGSILAALIVIGCSSSSSPDASCGTDTSVTGCAAGSTGYSCSGGIAPDTTLNCSDPVADANGNTDYCCATTTTGGSCTVDSAVDCTASGTTGYSCDTGALPPTSAGTCSDVTPTANGDTYCCGTVTTGSTCTSDTTVTGCESGSSGFSCTGTDTPAESGSLVCSEGIDSGSGDTLYCCTDITTPATCMPDQSVTGCTGDSYGFSCTGTDAPDATDTSIICSDGVAGSGDTLYCCSDVTVSSTCMADDSVTGCTGNSYGFSCTGSTPPDANDTSLICSEGVADSGDTIYCCVDNTDATCAQDDTVVCPTAGSFGLKCSTSADPTDPTLNCSAGASDPDGSSTDFCCTN